MESLYNFFPVWLEHLDQAVSFGTHYLSGAAGPIGLLGYLPPIALALISRQSLHILTAFLLCLATFAILRLGDPALATLGYAASYLIPAHAFWSRDQRRQSDVVAAKLSHIETEITTFLAALDRRTRDADREPARSPLPQPVPAERPEAAANSR